MHHNVSLDAHALQLIKNQKNFSTISYLGMLGPQHRTKQVMEKAQLSTNELPNKLANPIGFDLGGELPESIALSILSQAHAAIEKASGKSLGYYQTHQLSSIKQSFNHAS
jgi:xanthine/CO dehydrogenase XdhC/CoxF family maturation factor